MKSHDILSAAGHRSGMTVPEGYFDDFARKMTESLPRQPWEEGGDKDEADRHILKPHRTLWNTMRPYIYMAAMFAGIWCMMKMFDFMRPSASSIGLDANPRLTAAVSNPTFVNDYFLNSSDFDDMESTIYDDLYNEGFTPVSLVGDSEGDDDTLSHFN